MIRAVFSTPRDKHRSVNQHSLAVCTAPGLTSCGVAQRASRQENLIKESIKPECAVWQISANDRSQAGERKSARGLEWQLDKDSIFQPWLHVRMSGEILKITDALVPPPEFRI